MIKAWVNDVNTTSLRIVVSVFLAAVSILLVLIGVLFRNYTPSGEQTKILIGVAGVILTMMGFDVLQFIGKRFSDATYAAAKNPTQPVNVETPPPVAAPAAEGVAAPTAPVPPGADDPSSASVALRAAVTGIDHTKPVGAQVEGEGD